MDARVYGVPVTPRAGKAVDVNALWVNGLGGGRRAGAPVGADRRGPGARTTGPWRPSRPFRAVRLAVRRRRRGAGVPLAVRTDDDDTMRPNQLLAWSLPYAPLAPDPAALAAVSAALLTPLGPRSLAPDASGYRGRHRGGPAERDGAYHQGTVWPWLLGPLAAAREDRSRQRRVISRY